MPAVQHPVSLVSTKSTVHCLLSVHAGIFDCTKEQRHWDISARGRLFNDFASAGLLHWGSRRRNHGL